LQEIAGPWEVLFDSQWFYDQKSGEKPQNSKVDKAKMVFDKLEDWTSHAEEAVKYYSGIATYRKVFDFQSKNRDPKSIIYLDLGEVKNVARVRLNAKDLEVVWTAPWRVEIPAGLLRPTGNVLEIEVANLWPNRLVGDGMLPKENRRTSTNITTYEPVLPEKIVSTSNWGRGKCPKCVERLKGGKPPELLPSGLLGPVRVMAE
jgi:hypothetical protein